MVFDLVVIGSAIAVDPLPLTAFFVVRPSQRGVRKGAAFVFGWLVSMGIVVAVTVLATGNNPPRPDTVPSLAGLAVNAPVQATQKRQLGAAAQSEIRERQAAQNACLCNETWGPQLARGSAGEAGSLVTRR